MFEIYKNRKDMKIFFFLNSKRVNKYWKSSKHICLPGIFIKHL